MQSVTAAGRWVRACCVYRRAIFGAVHVARRADVTHDRVNVLSLLVGGGNRHVNNRVLCAFASCGYSRVASSSSPGRQ
eukprot:3013378-Prymnesium_polylepis.1